jgi:hypothetical protein
MALNSGTTMLPNDRDARNALPVWDGCVAYFPDCWAEIAKVSVIGNKQHALGEKLRFARDVSTDHANKVMRHMLDHAAGNVFDADGTYHLAKAAWRALAALQVAIEQSQPKSEENFKRPSVYSQATTTGPALILKLESDDPDQVGEYNGQTYRENEKRDTNQGLCGSGPLLPDRRPEPC